MNADAKLNYYLTLSSLLLTDFKNKEVLNLPHNISNNAYLNSCYIDYQRPITCRCN